MADALKMREAPAEITIYPDEGHAFSNSADRIDADLRVATLLDRHARPRWLGHD